MCVCARVWLLAHVWICVCMVYTQGVSAWPFTEAVASTALSYGLTIWLHTTANVTTDASKIACARGLNLITMYETYVNCPATAGVRYVTFQRFTTAPEALALQEVRVYRASG